jgi:ubiquinol-cytochrome c reductase cytochrome b subunit
MRIFKTNVLLRFVNSYLVDSPQPANISYLWNFGSLLALCLGIQILTGCFLAMHYIPNVDLAFNSVEHIMRDVDNGYILRYTHANVASFFFIFVYAHIGRGLWYGSYRAPRILVWSIGVIILILMMAKFWPNCKYEFSNFTYITSAMLPINKSRTKAIMRIGPHNKEVLDLIICGMLGNFWADTIPGKLINSTRFQIEQSIINAAYIHYLTLYFYNLGYCARPIPVLVKKTMQSTNFSSLNIPYISTPSEGSNIGYKDIIENRLNYRLTLFSFTSFNWIYESFYIKEKGRNVIKKVPLFISEYLTPKGLANWIMQDGSYQKGQGVNIATNSFTYEDCKFLALILTNKYNLKTSVVKSGKPNQWRLSIWKESMPKLAELVGPHFIPEMEYKLKGYL